jgi:hypothetical protein
MYNSNVLPVHILFHNFLPVEDKKIVKSKPLVENVRSLWLKISAKSKKNCRFSGFKGC